MLGYYTNPYYARPNTFPNQTSTTSNAISTYAIASSNATTNANANANACGGSHEHIHHECSLQIKRPSV